MATLVIGIVAAGAMGSAVARRLHDSGCTVLTDLAGRSEDTRRRAREAGMEATTLEDIASRAKWVLSILPPRDARSFAEKFLAAYTSIQKTGAPNSDKIVFVDCNAVNPVSVKGIASIFAHTPQIQFIDAAIIGGPPNPDGYNPTFYASAQSEDGKLLDEFASLAQYGLKISLLQGQGAGIGDASALKMSYAGISKGFTGLLTTMILAAHSSSPATAKALIRELNASQPVVLKGIPTRIPSMIPKAYRWVGEMEEIAAFVGEGEGDIYHGLAQLYQRVEKAVGSGSEDLQILNEVIEDAKQVLDAMKRPIGAWRCSRKLLLVVGPDEHGTTLTLMAPIRDKFTIHSKAVVCQDVDLKGDITIGAGTIVHPKATIFAIGGPIVIGMNCIIEESAIIVNRRKQVMRIGDDNLFEIGCRVECPSTGNYNTVSTRARVHHTVRLSSYCVIGAGCLVAPSEDEIIDDYTTIYGPDAQRRVWSGRGKVQEADLRKKHVEYLRDTLPKFNRLRRGDAT
ncbi:hypothetical protein EYR40_006792 [Pleurotus pulmonarius]|nr:hypothetical protein EYR36_011410 [Pleurotus pulmonarius]KAF4599693.1 hypothetical protein EYR40_006792 [Pleurotus pulmonarius]